MTDPTGYPVDVYAGDPDFARGPVAFAHPECCDLGPVKVTEVLEVLRPFAETASTFEANEAFQATQSAMNFNAARSLYLKLGGQL